MIRQTHTYLAGAVSGTALVAAAIVAFVLLVSLQALKDWPLAGIGVGGNDSAASSPSRDGGTNAQTAGVGSAGGATAGSATAGGSARDANRRSAAAQADKAALGTAPAPASGGPIAEAPPSGPTSPAAGGPSASSPPGSASSSADGGNGGGSTPGAGTGSGSSAGGGSQSTSGTIANTVNKTVAGVDEATGGVVGATGTTEATEKVVEGVAGPESTVGKTVDEAVKTVGGLLGGNH
jgi:hypothetical protein